MSRSMNERLIREFVRLVIAEKLRSQAFKWSHFKSLASLDEQFSYLKSTLQLIGQGTSRAAFVLSSGKTLKIVKPTSASTGDEIGPSGELNDPERMVGSGHAQNEFEYQVSQSSEGQEVLARVIDRAENFSWILSELVRPLKNEDDLLDLLDQDKFGSHAQDPIEYHKMRKDRGPGFPKNGFWKSGRPHVDISAIFTAIYSAVEQHFDAEKLKNRGFSEKSIDFVENVANLQKKFDLAPGDIKRLDNLGRTADGRLVLLDYGASKDIIMKHYW